MIIGLTGYGTVIGNLPIVAVIPYVTVLLPLSFVGLVYCVFLLDVLFCPIFFVHCLTCPVSRFYKPIHVLIHDE